MRKEPNVFFCCHVNFVFNPIHYVQCLVVVATSKTTVLFSEKAS